MACPARRLPKITRPLAALSGFVAGSSQSGPKCSGVRRDGRLTHGPDAASTLTPSDLTRSPIPTIPASVQVATIPSHICSDSQQALIANTSACNHGLEHFYDPRRSCRTACGPSDGLLTPCRRSTRAIISDPRIPTRSWYTLAPHHRLRAPSRAYLVATRRSITFCRTGLGEHCVPWHWYASNLLHTRAPNHCFCESITA